MPMSERAVTHLYLLYLFTPFLFGCHLLRFSMVLAVAGEACHDKPNLPSEHERNIKSGFVVRQKDRIIKVREEESSKKTFV